MPPKSKPSTPAKGSSNPPTEPTTPSPASSAISTVVTPVVDIVKRADHAVSKRKGSLSISKLYLIFYNAASTLAWGYVLVRLSIHMGQGLATEGWKEKLGLAGVDERFRKTASSGFDDFGLITKWVQTAALLELVHTGLGLVRSSIVTTAAQVSSRILLVWYICHWYPSVAATPAYITMVFAWSFTEVVRYTHYVTGLLGVKNHSLEWLRYTTFYILYPLGAGSEATLIWLSKDYARGLYGPVGQYATLAILAIWPPALLFMMSHMHAQRRKHVGSMSDSKAGKKAKKGLKETQSAIKARLESANSTAMDSPARSTRSKSKAH